MKLRPLVPNFYIHVSRSDLYIPTIGLIWNLCFLVLCERELWAQPQEQREGQGSAPRPQAVVGGSSLPSPLPLWLSQESHK